MSSIATLTAARPDLASKLIADQIVPAAVRVANEGIRTLDATLGTICIVHNDVRHQFGWYPLPCRAIQADPTSQSCGTPASRSQVPES